MHVIVVGAGPSGFSLSLALAREGIEVTLLERDRVVSDQPRAAHLTAPGIQFLRRIGVLDDIQKAGFPPKNLAYRKLDGTAVVTIEDTALSTIPDPTVVLTQNYLGNILLSHAEKTSGISINWGCRVIDVGQDENSAWAVIQQDDGTEKKITGDFLCGCDGGTSQVRKSLFGAGNFPGTTWDFQFVAADVYYPFDKFGYEDVNMVMHPEHCHLVARIAKDELWRVAYQEDKDMTYQQVVDNQPAKFELLLPGHPKPGSYALTHLSPYRLHQRCAEKFRVGRICLAADAAHLCNPWGGLGLTGGFADVAGLSECLLGIANGQADHSILDKYDEVRRGIYNSIINPVSTTNLQRVSMSDPDKALEDPVLAKLATASTDPKVRGELEKGAYALCYDFTQHYNSKM